MRFRRPSVPDRHHLSRFGIPAGDHLIVVENGVAALDGVFLREQRSVVGVGLPGGALVPLEVADPEDEPLDVAAGRVVGSELVPLPGVEGAFEQGPEDGGLHHGPVLLGSVDEVDDLVGAQRQDGGVLEEPAVEVGNLVLDGDREVGAGSHVLPEGLKHGDEPGRFILHGLQEPEEGIGRQEADILRKHGEEATLQETRRDLRVVPVLLQRLGEIGEGLGHLPRDLGGVLGRVEGMRFAPDLTKEVAGFLFVEVLEPDPSRAGIREGFVLPTRPGELRVEVEAMPDIADNQEWWATFLGGQEMNIALRLGVGAVKGLVPRGRTALTVAGRFRRGGIKRGQQRLIGVGLVPELIDPLLCFEDEVAGLVEVNPVRRAGAVRLESVDPALECVVVEGVVGLRWIGPVEPEQFAELHQEWLPRTAFVPTGLRPLLDKEVDLGGGWFGHAASLRIPRQAVEIVVRILHYPRGTPLLIGAVDPADEGPMDAFADHHDGVGSTHLESATEIRPISSRNSNKRTGNGAALCGTTRNQRRRDAHEHE